MAFACSGGTCVHCGKTIHHSIEPTGRMTPPYGIEVSDGTYYSYLKGELCKSCDDKLSLDEKDPEMAKTFDHISKQIKKLNRKRQVQP